MQPTVQLPCAVIYDLSSEISALLGIHIRPSGGPLMVVQRAMTDITVKHINNFNEMGITKWIYFIFKLLL